MRTLFFFILFQSAISLFAQQENRLSTLDFVEILNGNKKEAYFYYHNNWEKLREAALKKGYIHSYEIMKTSATEDAPFDLVLMTTYNNRAAYENRENRFSELIEQAGQLKLLNSKKPNEFRKTLFSKERVEHLNTKM